MKRPTPTHARLSKVALNKRNKQELLDLIVRRCASALYIPVRSRMSKNKFVLIDIAHELGTLLAEVDGHIEGGDES